MSLSFYLLCGLLYPALHLLFMIWRGDGLPHSNDFKYELMTSLVFSFVSYLGVIQLIPGVKEMTLKADLFGKDLCKAGSATQDKLIPESLGLVSGVVFLVSVIGLQVVYGTTIQKLLEFNVALLSICFMLFLGFADDVLDLRWRHKFLMPAIACLPLLCFYYSEKGLTTIVIPIPFRPLLGHSEVQLTWLGEIVTLIFPLTGNIIDLHAFYYIYMAMVTVFCTNAINIYAGINGLEAGQSLVIAVSVLTMNLYEIIFSGKFDYIDGHIFSAIILLPFIGVTLGLLKYNWYPSQVFVGDTFCYFAGMTFAVVAILGHFSKSLLLFLIPQILNFLYSLPQLYPSWVPFAVPCPRHRLPKFNQETGLVEPSRIPLNLHPGNYANMTLINLALRITGPLHEKTLCIVLLSFQVLCSILGFIIRYWLAEFFF